MPADPIVFFERPYPSANMVLVRGQNPILLDTGYGSDLQETENLLRGAGTPPEALSLIVNSHYHCDHAGGNARLQRDYGIPVAAHRWEAALVNGRDREACGVEWLDQPIEPYRVDRPLSDGDELDAGPMVLRVIHTPGHTLGHISLYAPEEETLLLGDAVHGDDVAWLNPFREGVGAALRALETLDRLSALPARRAFSGHGTEVRDLQAAIDRGRRRYEKWLEESEKAYWHACKRIFGYALMIYGGLEEGEVAPYLLRCPWFGDYARHGFGTEPEAFIDPLVAEMLRSKAAGWRDRRLVALPPHNAPSPGWPSGPTRPKDWPGLRQPG
ncbi:MAG: MBL fold metallo-hydrolase [Actinomycetota bacterium]|nr:MBL fold metallo-hydrolase [Actinomycetota bacterium]